MIKRIFTTAVLLASFGFCYSQTLSVSPANGNRGQSLPIIISGNSTNFTTQGSATTAIYLSQGSSVLGQGQNILTNITIVDPATIKANLQVPQNAATGNYDLTVTAGNTYLQNSAFTINPASNASISMAPNGSKPGVSTTVTITIPGGNFKTQAQLIEKVWLNKGSEIIEDINNITVQSPTTFTADINISAGATMGLWEVNVYTDDNTMYTTPDAFTIDASFSLSPAEEKKFSIYPNPVQEFLFIEYGNNSLTNLQFRVLDLTGKSIVPDAEFTELDKSIKIDLGFLDSGAYIIQLLSDDQIIATERFVKK